MKKGCPGLGAFEKLNVLTFLYKKNKLVEYITVINKKNEITN